MASVREALGRFNIVPSLDFENESLIEIPVRKSGDSMPQPPVIEINPGYNPFNSDEQASHKTGFIEKYERENTTNWEKLYSALERGEELPETAARINETGRKFFQIRNKYIVCPVKSGLMLIDQKRAHERILCEKFLECLSKNRSISQTELFPVSAELNPADILVLKEIGEDLKILGFNIGFPGKNKIIVKGLPSGSDSSDPVGMLGILIEEFRNARSDLAAGAREKLAAAMAAASAIPYGKSLTQSEMENLFDSLFACSAPNYSPKGKPIVIIITLEDIDKKFK
jgi:DNA mismatch repair protein MutL